jgi:hypothetical protein
MGRLAGAGALARAARERRPDLAAAEAMGVGGGAAGFGERETIGWIVCFRVSLPSLCARVADLT